MPSISIEIPSEIAHAAKLTPAELRLELAVHLFSTHRLSFGKAREMVGMTVADFQQLLGMRKIAPHYDLAEYQEDLETLSRLGRI